MAITLTPGTAVNQASGTTMTVPLPSGLVDGDWVLLLVGVNATNPSITTPTGWTVVVPSTVMNSSTAAAGAIFVKKWASGDANPVPGVGSRAVGICIRIAGADAATFLDVSPVITNPAGLLNNFVAPAITPTVADAAVVRAFFGRSGSNTTTISYTTPTGETAAGYAPGVTTSTNTSAASFYRTDIAAGVSAGTSTTTSSTTSSSSLSISFAIKPLGVQNYTPSAADTAGATDAVSFEMTRAVADTAAATDVATAVIAPPAASLVDTFDTQSAELTGYSADVFLSGGALNIQPRTGYPRLESTKVYTLRGSTFTGELLQLATTSGTSASTSMVFRIDATNFIELSVSPTSANPLGGRFTSGGVASDVYFAAVAGATHYRIEVTTGGQILWRAYASGAWTTFRTATMPAAWNQAVGTMRLLAGFFTGTETTGQAARWGSINVDPAAAGTNYTPSAADAAGAVDAADTAVAAQQAAADSAAAADAVTTTTADAAAAGDVAGAVDAAATTLTRAAQAADTAAATDAATVTLGQAAGAADTAAAADAVSTVSSEAATATDTAAATDAVTTARGASATPADVAAATDAVTFTRALAADAADTAGAVDAVSTADALARTAADTAGAVDAAAATATALMETLVDPFTSQNSTLWTYPGTNVTVDTGTGELVITPTTGYPRITSAALYNILGSYLVSEFTTLPTATVGSSPGLSIKVVIDATNAIELAVSETGAITCRVKTNGTDSDVQYERQVGATHYRIRVTTDRLINFECFAYGDWRPLRRNVAAAAGWNLNAVQAQVLAGYWNAADTGITQARVGSVGILPTVTDNRKLKFGAAVGGTITPSTIASLTTAAGRSPGVELVFRAWSLPINTVLLQQIHDRGALPVYTWEAWDYTGPVNAPYALARINAGDFDAYITTSAQEIKALGFPVVMRIFHEFNSGSYPWGIGQNGNTTADLIAAWQRVWNIFAAQGVTNVKWFWCPNIRVTAGTVAAGYPGDAYVDIVGVDAYNQGGASWTPAWALFNNTFNEIRSVATGKPMWIGETSSSETGGDKAAWWNANGPNPSDKGFFRWARGVSDLVVFEIFDLLKEEDWRVDSTEASRVAFATELALLAPDSEQTDLARITDAITAVLTPGALSAIGTDTAAVTDAVTVTRTTATAAADTAAATDAATAGVQDWDGATPWDPDAPWGPDVVNATTAAADTAGAVDAATVVESVARTAADVAAATDAASVVEAVQQTATDAAAATDAASTVTGRTAAAADTAGATDAVSVVAGQGVSAADVAAATDAVTVVRALGVIAADTAGATDATATSEAQALTVADSAGAVDSLTTASADAVTAADLAGAVDNVTADIGVLGTAADVAAAVDAASYTTARAPGATDTAGSTDAVTWQMTRAYTVADTAGAVDLLTLAAALARSVADTAGASDTVLAGPVRRLTVADTAAAVDAATAALVAFAGAFDIRWGQVRTGEVAGSVRTAEVGGRIRDRGTAGIIGGQ